MYIPHTPDDVRKMLEAVGVSSVDELYRRATAMEPIPSGSLDMPPAMDLPGLTRHLEDLSIARLRINHVHPYPRPCAGDLWIEVDLGVEAAHHASAHPTAHRGGVDVVVRHGLDICFGGIGSGSTAGENERDDECDREQIAHFRSPSRREFTTRRPGLRM